MKRGVTALHAKVSLKKTLAAVEMRCTKPCEMARKIKSSIWLQIYLQLMCFIHIMRMQLSLFSACKRL
jgi:hypothetical protein